MNSLTINYPDDFHIHLRDGACLQATVKDACHQFRRVMVMPNLKAPVTTVAKAKIYHKQILAEVPQGKNFTPLMTLYLTNETTPDTIIEAKNSGIIYGCKWYPQGATTHSEAGVTQIDKLLPTLAALSEHNIPLLIHGEVTGNHIDIFDRESIFIKEQLVPLTQKLPNLKIVLEHISTETAVHFVTTASPNIAATITAHHLLFNRNALFVGGIRPHYYCLPILKRSSDQKALIAAAISGNPKFFLGTDSAPHPKSFKENSCGCAGIYTAHAALALYLKTFEAANALDKFAGFASHYGADFYGLPHNTETIILTKQPFTVPNNLPFGNDTLIPLMAGETLNWAIQAG